MYTYMYSMLCSGVARRGIGAPPIQANRELIRPGENCQQDHSRRTQRIMRAQTSETITKNGPVRLLLVGCSTKKKYIACMFIFVSL